MNKFADTVKVEAVWIQIWIQIIRVRSLKIQIA